YSDNITFDSNHILFDTVPSEYVFAIISGIIVDVPHTPIFKFNNNTIEVGEIGGTVFFGNSDNVDFIVSNNKFKNIRRIVFSKGKQTVVGNVVEKGQLRCENLKNSFIGYNTIIDGNPKDNNLEG